MDPLTDDDWEVQLCDECDWYWDITRVWRAFRTLTLCLYEAQPWMNHIHVMCPKCHHLWRIFGLKPGVYTRLSRSGVRKREHKFAPDEVSADFEQFFGIHAVTPKKLTPRQERLVEFYRHELERDETDPGS